MAKRHSILALLGAFALIVGACGDPDEPNEVGAGGAGGEGGEVGVGGEGGTTDTGYPVVEAIEPATGGPCFRIKVVGKNFSTATPRNSLYFVSQEGSTNPTLEAKGVSADSEGTSFQVDVPSTAKSGPTRAVIQVGADVITVDGPEFTVTDEKLPPVATTFTPSVITAGERTVEVSVSGAGFYENLTTLTVNEADHPIEWEKSSSTRCPGIYTQAFFSLPPELVTEPGTIFLQFKTPSPGGGETPAYPLRVVPPINLLEAEAVARRVIRLQFDQHVPTNPDRGHFSIPGFKRRDIERVTTTRGNPFYLDVQLSRNTRLNEGQTYTMVVDEKFVSLDGGAIGDRTADFLPFVEDK